VLVAMKISSLLWTFIISLPASLGIFYFIKESNVLLSLVGTTTGTSCSLLAWWVAIKKLSKRKK